VLFGPVFWKIYKMLKRVTNGDESERQPLPAAAIEVTANAKVEA